MAYTLNYGTIKRLIFSTICYLFSGLLLHAQTANEVFEENGQFGLKNSFGDVLISPKFQALGWHPNTDEPIGEWLGYRQSGKWGLMNIEGKKLTTPRYYSIEPFSSGLFLVSSKGSLSNQLKYGLIDGKGNHQLSNAFFEISALDGFYLVSNYDAGELTYGVFNGAFEQILEDSYLKIERIGQVFAAMDAGGFWYFFRENGTLVSDEEVDTYEVSSSYILIRRNGAEGLINTQTGTVLYKPVYKEISNLDGEPAPVAAKTWQIYDWSLDPIVELAADSISSYGELLVASINGGQRFFADSIEILANKQLELVRAEKGFAIARTDDQFEVFDYSGKKVLHGDSVYFDGAYFFGLSGKSWDIYNLYGRKINPYPLQAVMPSQSQYIPVKRTGQWGLLDFSGKQIVPNVYDSIGVGTESTFPAKYVGSWGIINAFGNWLVQPGYFSIDQLSDLFVAEGNGFRSLITSRGKNLLTTRFELKEGNSSIEMLSHDGRGLITREGLVIFDPIYDNVRHLGDFYAGQRPEGAVIKDGLGAFVVRLDDGVQQVLDYSEGFFLVKKDDLYGFLDDKGRIRIANRYDSARRFSEEMAPVKLIGKWGFINKNERLVIQPQFTEVGDFKNGRAIVHRDHYGLVDQEGKEVLEVSFKIITRTEEGSYILEDQQGRKGLANSAGEFILFPSFDEMQDVGHGLIIAERKGKKGLYDHSGQLKLGFDYGEIIPGERYLYLLPIRQ
ncbi:MAG: WG repeat-containing protein [Cytophagales bacterium]|nr:WG repeat-containing protein [Cytophagales bacterium]